MARTVADVAVMFEAMQAARLRRAESSGPTSSASRKTTSANGWTRSVRAALTRTTKALAAAGHTIRTVAVENAARTPEVYLHIVLPEASWYHAPLLAAHADRYSPGVRLRLEMGRYVLAEDYVRALSPPDGVAARCRACATGLRRLAVAGAAGSGAPPRGRNRGCRRDSRTGTSHDAAAHAALQYDRSSGDRGAGWSDRGRLARRRADRWPARAHRPAPQSGVDGGTLQHRRRRIGRRRHRVSVRHVFRFGVPRRYGQSGARWMIDDIGRMRRVWLWWLLDHEWIGMQHGCRGAPMCQTRPARCLRRSLARKEVC